MNHQLEYRRAVATFRCLAVMGIGTGGRVGLAEELNRVAFDNMLRTVVEIRLVNRQFQCDDTVATVHGCQRVVIRTAFS